MKNIIILFLFSTLVLASNPKVYAALGDVIYDNIDNIEKLKEIKQYEKMVSKIDKYVKEVEDTKKIGFDIEMQQDAKNKKTYLMKLRELSKTNDFFVHSAKSSFKSSIDNEENELFFKIINSGLINTDRYKNEIKKYYMNHSEDVNTTGVIQSFLDEDEEMRKRREALRSSYKTKEQIQAEKIKRIREKDRKKQEALQKSLEEELIEKKIKIRREQEKELAK